MTREEIRKDILGINNRFILAELPTSVGKSRIAIEFIAEKKITGNILIVVPRLMLFENWKEEFKKWGYESYIDRITFTTYVSFPKFINQHFDIIVFDECHHLSERAREGVNIDAAKYFILLSATVSKNHKKELKYIFPGIECYKISMKEAIDENILPDPKVFLVPLTLKAEITSESFIINPKAKGEVVEIPFADRFKARQRKDTKWKVICTQKQYYDDLSSLVEYYKKSYFRTNNQMMYFRWQKAAKDRLTWLAGLKNDVAKQILKILNKKRTLTFCNGIEQTEALGKYCINSKNEDSAQYLEKFNKGQIHHITACNILNEGANLTKCQVGIFVSINSSDIMMKQKNGRILRHSEPIIILIYYKDTREEELVEEIVKNYNPELITVVNDLEQLKNDL